MNTLLLILSILFLFAGIVGGISEQDFGMMFVGIVLGVALLIWRANRIKNAPRDSEYGYEYGGTVESSSNASHNSSVFPNKVGIRTPSISKSIAGRTTAKAKRKIKSAIDPTYNVKGMGFVKNPKRSIKNKIYKKTTKSLFK